MPTYFEQFLHDHRQGGMLNDLSEKLEEAVADAVNSGKTASVALVIDIKSEGVDRTGSNRVSVSDKITAKRPVPNVESSLFFVTGENQLSRRNPNQLTLQGLNAEKE